MRREAAASSSSETSRRARAALRPPELLGAGLALASPLLLTPHARPNALKGEEQRATHDCSRRGAGGRPGSSTATQHNGRRPPPSGFGAGKRADDAALRQRGRSRYEAVGGSARRAVLTPLPFDRAVRSS